MDVSKYNFSCQKALHQGLQLSKSLGHKVLEVEHVAVTLLRMEELPLDPNLKSRVQAALQATLSQIPKSFGVDKIGFGKRLDKALDQAEAQAKGEKVEAELLWSALLSQSSAIKMAVARFAEEASRADEFEPLVPNEQSTTVPKRAKQKEEDVTTQQERKRTELLARYTTDLSEIAERGEIDPVIGRDTELRRVLEILGRKKKNNPILLGEPGVGKSAIAEALAMKIAEGTVPPTMRGKRVLALDLGSLLAGSKYRGEFEQRMKDLLGALQELKGKIILFIDEIHMLVGAGSSEGSTDAANLLKPALARGEILALGATTLDEYREFIEADAALERRFQPIIVDEPNAATALSILRGIKRKYEIHHAVRISDAALQAAVKLSMRYLTHRRLPDKAIDLVDEAASKLRLQIDSVPAALDELNAKITQLEIEKNGIGKSTKDNKALLKIETHLAAVRKEHDAIDKIWKEHQHFLERLRATERSKDEAKTMYDQARQAGNFALASQLQFEKIPQFEDELKSIRSELERLQKQHDFLVREVGKREIAHVVAVWTGIPLSKVLEDDVAQISSLDMRLKLRVFGQDQAVEKVGRAIKRAKVGIADPNRPQGVFMFIGPTGVGKTEMAKAIAAEVFSDESRMIRVDMSEYMEAHNVSRLIGSPPGYVGFGEGGELTEAIKMKPHSLILFDEIEKAHPRVLDILLQLFDEGRLTDAKGRLFDFRNTFIVLTSNLAVEGSSDGFVRSALARELRPEFVNRIDEIIMFEPLNARHCSTLVDKLLSQLNMRLAERDFRIQLGPLLRQQLVDEGTNSEFGGRALRRAFEMQVVDAVSERIISDPLLCKGAWLLEIDSDHQLGWREDTGLHKFLPAAKIS